jgi:cyclopropane fatty-acyl-phospholipid synthase-like methyltransferase
VLDIGCGWGGSLKYAAEKYGVGGVGITVSKQQADLARANCAGLPIEIRLLAWRDNFQKAWPELSKTRDQRFHRMWCYYLSSVAAGFRSRNADVWQVLMRGA